MLKILTEKKKLHVNIIKTYSKRLALCFRYEMHFACILLNLRDANKSSVKKKGLQIPLIFLVLSFLSSG